MSWLIIIIVILIVAGLMLLGGDSSKKERSREEFLKDLAEYLEGELEPVEGQENSFRIRFRFENQDFIYQDIQTKGFKDTFFKTYLKAETSSHLTLDFTEKEHQKFIRPEVMRSPESPEQGMMGKQKVIIPKKLKEFDIHTNNAVQTNQLLADPKVLRILLEFRNVDSRGYHFLSLKIFDGTIILEFHPSGRYHPMPLYLLHSLESIEDLLDKLLVIVNKLNYLS